MTSPEKTSSIVDCFFLGVGIGVGIAAGVAAVVYFTAGMKWVFG